jgi:DUF971 family protein
MKINRFVLNDTQKFLLVEFINSNSYQLPYEYLRVNSPNLKKVKGTKELVTHKKQVMLSAIECVAKHGYRLIFDDSHSSIYSHDYFAQLALEQEQRWQDYLTQLQHSGHSREAMIDFKQI